MIAITDNYKLACTLPAKQIAVTVTDGVDPITGGDDLKGLKIWSDGAYCKTVMKQAEITYFGSHDYLDSYVNIKVGIYLPTKVDKGAVTISIATPAVVTLSTHGLVTGDRIAFTTDDTLPTGIITTQFYYVIKKDANNFWIATTYANAIAGTKVATSGSQSGTHHVYYYDGTTSANVEYLDHGDFKVVEVEEDIKNGTKILKCYDRMYEALQLYALSLTYPQTLLQIVQGVCTELGWTLTTTDFFNYDLSVADEPFLGQGLLYRNVLDMIAEASGTTVLFSGDQLVLKPAGASVATLETSDLLTLELQPRWGELNSLCLSRQPQEDNIVEQDEESIAEYGLFELKLANNLILDVDRETYISPLFAEIKGLIYYPLTVKTVGIGCYEAGDIITVTDLDSNTYDTLISSIAIELTGGYRETLTGTKPTQTATDYTTAGIIGQTIKKTEIVVNKQEGEISMLVGDTTALQQTTEAITLTAQSALDLAEENADDIAQAQTDITELEVRADGLEVSVSQQGGSNLLKNSTGLKGTLEEWQVFDENGDLVDPTNTGTCISNSDVKENTEANSAIFIDEQFITQTCATIVDQTYTLYCRFRKNDAVTVSITGIADPLDLTITDYVDDTWAVYKYQFTATSENTTITFDASSGDAYIADAVLKLGDINGWIQAPNEVYGTNFRFDKDGFSITSEDDYFQSTLDNTSLSVYDTSTSKTMMTVSKDEGKLTNLTAQDTFSVQRYDTPAKRVRFIPTATGLYIVVND